MSDTIAPEPVLLVEKGDGVAIFTLNRPRAMNSVNGALATALGNALEDAAADDDVRVVVITGAGERAFCAGMDLKAFAAGESVEPEGHPEWGFAGIARHVIDKPVIAAVNGFALGGGTELALSTDLIVADEQAAFGLPEVLRGLFAAGGGVLRIAQQLPPRVATELVLTGRHMPAEEALRWGLINEVAPAGTALERALVLAGKIVAAAPLSIAVSKSLMRRSALADTWGEEPWEWNEEALGAIFASADAQEGASAFAEKRPPVWTGR